MSPEYLQLGALGIILIFAIKEFFSYLKTKGKDNGNGILNGKILEELRMMNQNHLHSIQEAIEKGNSRLIDCIHNDNTKMIELLGEIKGRLK